MPRLEVVKAAVAPDSETLDDRARVRSAAFVGIMVVAANGLNAVFHFFVARFLPPAQYSLLATLFLIVTVSSVPTLSLQAVVARDVVKRRGADGDAGVGMAIREVFAGLWPKLLVLLVTAAAVAYPLALWLHLSHPLPAIATAVAVLAGLLAPIIWGALQGTERFVAFGLSQAGFALAKFIVGVGLAAAGFGAAAVMFGVALASVLVAVGSLWPVRGQLLATRGRKVISRKLGTKYVTAASTALTLFVALTGLDLIVSRLVFHDGTSGAYAAASVGARLLLVIPLAITTVLFPRVASLQDAAKERRYLLAGVMSVGVLGLVGAVALLAFPHLLIQIAFGARYDMAAPWIGPLGIAMALYGVVNVYLFHFLAQGRSGCTYLLSAAVVLQAAGYALFHAHPIDLVYVQLIVSGALVLGCELFDRGLLAKPALREHGAPA